MNGYGFVAVFVFWKSNYRNFMSFGTTRFFMVGGITMSVTYQYF